MFAIKVSSMFSPSLTIGLIYKFPVDWNFQTGNYNVLKVKRRL